ncbi:MAG: hypothetical protein ACFFC7_31570 [Candidatus Hermodarchaeota archaeon]
MPICPARKTVNNEIVTHCIECGESLENVMGMSEEERKRLYMERGKTEIQKKPLSIRYSIGY